MKNLTLFVCLVGIFVISGSSANEIAYFKTDSDLVINEIDLGNMDLHHMKVAENQEVFKPFKDACNYLSERVKSIGDFCDQTRRLCETFSEELFNIGDNLFFATGEFIDTRNDVTYLRLTQFMKHGSFEIEVHGLVGLGAENKLGRIKSVWTVKEDARHKTEFSASDVYIKSGSVEAKSDDNDLHHPELLDAVISLNNSDHVTGYYAAIFTKFANV